MGEQFLCCGIINCVCSTVTVILFVISIPTMSVEFEHFWDRVTEGPYYHTVGDTRIISIDRSTLIFCSGLMLAVNRDESTVNATLYALSMFPALDGRNELNHTLSIHSKDDYDYYYLHPGSNVTVSACTHNTQYSFDIIRGRQNFELWQAGKRGRVFASFEVDYNAWCRGPSTNTSYTVYQMTIPEEDDWYFAADASAATANLSLQRYEYSVTNSFVLSSCDAGGSNPDSCTVAIKSYLATYPLKIGQGHSRSNVKASVNCVVNGGLVASVVIPVVVILILSVCICVICIIAGCMVCFAA